MLLQKEMEKGILGVSVGSDIPEANPRHSTLISAEKQVTSKGSLQKEVRPLKRSSYSHCNMEFPSGLDG